VSNLYLATTPKQKSRHWETARNVMTRLGVPAQRIEHVIASQEPAVLAAVVDELQKGLLKLDKPRPAPPPGDKTQTQE
jgi:hypothetical protein